MKKYFLILIIFVSFFFIQIFSSQPVKADFCGVSCWTDNNCQINEQTSVLNIANKKACMINPACDDEQVLGSPTSYCSYLVSGRSCQVDSCPDYDGQNGATCEVAGGCWAGVTSGGCEKVKQTGKWDRSEKKCVQCDQQNYHKEVTNCGDTSGIHLNLGSSCSNWNCGGAGDSYCNWAGDQQFESACGADSVCDEKVEGNSCETGGKVCTSGECVCPAGQTWDSAQNRCIVQLCICSDNTAKGLCSTVNPGKRCVDIGGNNCQLQADPTCAGCAAALSLSPGAGDPCTVSATISGNCYTKSYEVREVSTVKCSGTTSATGAGSCSIPQSGTSSHTYKLYVDGIEKDTKSATCPPGPTACSGYNSEIPCETSLTVNCDWCPPVSLSVSGRCVPQGTLCTVTTSCSGKSQSACTGDCAWCSSSGGCVVAKDYTTQCDSCYKEQDFTLASAWAYCDGRCKSTHSGYISSWCKPGTTCFNTGDASCTCTGLVFDSSKSNDGIMNCGECAINANNNDCGGTAATYGNHISYDVLGKVMYNDDLSSCNYGGASNEWGFYQNYAHNVGSALRCCQIPYPTADSIASTRYNRDDYFEQTCAKEVGRSSAPEGTVSTEGIKLGEVKWRSSDSYCVKCLPDDCNYNYEAKGYTSSALSCCSAAGFIGTDSVLQDSFYKEMYYGNLQVIGYYCMDDPPYLSGVYTYSECSDNIDNDRDCLVDCDDPDCSGATACASKATKTSCNMPGGTGCGATCPSGQDCVSGVCQPFDFSLSTSPSSKTINQGDAASTRVTATLLSGSSQSVGLSYSGVPPSSTPVLSPSSVNPTATGALSTLSVVTSLSTPPGTYPITITGTGGGKTKTATYTLTVNDGTPPVMYCANPNYFSVTPASPTDYDQITITATATDNTGVSKIELLAENSVIKTCNNVNSCSTKTGSYPVRVSPYTMAAKAYDAANNVVQCSKQINVVSLPVNCPAARLGQQCNVGDVGKTVDCGCVRYVCN